MVIRRLLLALLTAGVVCTGAGVALAWSPLASATFGWTAYSPLSDTTYRPADPVWLTWSPRIGLALIAIGAGSVGAGITALVLRRSRTR